MSLHLTRVSVVVLVYAIAFNAAASFATTLSFVENGTTYTVSQTIGGTYTLDTAGNLTTPNVWNYANQACSDADTASEYWVLRGHYDGSHVYWTQQDSWGLNWYTYRIPQTQGIVYAFLKAKRGTTDIKNLEALGLSPDGGPSKTDAGGHTRISYNASFSYSGLQAAVVKYCTWANAFGPSSASNPVIIPPEKSQKLHGSFWPYFVETDASKQNLVCVIHGYTDSGTSSWTATMADSIRAQLAVTGKDLTWTVKRWDWSGWSNAVNFKGPPGSDIIALSETSGRLLGQSIVKAGVRHVHLIAHSIGSSVAQNAIDYIQTYAPGQMTIHVTFLDAYTLLGVPRVKRFIIGPSGVSLVFEIPWREYLGKGADFAEHYFNYGDLPHTDETLVHAANFNITSMRSDSAGTPYYYDPRPSRIPYSEWLAVLHFWPVRWYQHTINEVATPKASNILTNGVVTGFSVGEEAAGTWTNTDLLPDNGTTVFLPHDGRARILARATQLAVQYSHSLALDQVPWFQDGNVAVSPISLTVSSQHDAASNSSGWVATPITTAEPINVLTFNLAFSSTASASPSVLSVSIDGEDVGYYDNTTWGAGAVTISLTKTLPAGAHTFAWRMTSDSGGTSTATISDIQMQRLALATTYADWVTANALTGSNAAPDSTLTPDGITNLLKFGLGLPAKDIVAASDLPSLTIESGQAVFRYTLPVGLQGVTSEVQASTDLRNWITVTKLPTVEASTGTEEAFQVTMPFNGPGMFVRFKLKLD